MQVQAPPAYSPPAFTPPGGTNGAGLFNAFYDATAPIAFDFASGLTPRSDDVAAIVASAYDEVHRAHESTGAPYHAVPLLTAVYAASARYPRPPPQASRPGAEAIGVLGEPHRSVLHLTERHKFSVENTALIVGLTTAEVVEAHEDARAVAHGVSAALALCPGGVPACPALAAEMDPGAGTVAQTELILDHAERCDACLQRALVSPDPIRALRSVGLPMTPQRRPPAPSAAGPGPGPAGYPAATATPFVAAATAQPPGLVPLPGPIPVPAPSLVSKAVPAKRTWSPLRLWSSASGWQKSGAIMAVILIAALVVAIATGSDEADVSARTNGSSTAQDAPNPKAPIPAIPPTTTPPTTTTPITTAPNGNVQVQPSTTYPGSNYSSSSNVSGQSSQSSSPSTQPPQAPATSAPPSSAPPAAAPPEMTSYTWGPSRYPKVPTTPLTRDIDFSFVTTGTSVTYTTSWGASGNLLSGEGMLALKAAPVGTQSIMLTINGPGGPTTASFQTPMF